jgi:hypothetical protein
MPDLSSLLGLFRHDRPHYKVNDETPSARYEQQNCNESNYCGVDLEILCKTTTNTRYHTVSFGSIQFLNLCHIFLEPLTRFELVTPSLPWKCSTPELQRQICSELVQLYLC